MKSFRALFLVFCICLVASFAFAAVPHLINYQGRLTDVSGNPLTGSYDVNFKIYDAETAGNLLWQETQTAVVVDKGLFGILLGSVTALNIPFDQPYFLEIKVGTEVMSPRQRITSTGYAIRAENAEKLNGKADTDFVLTSDITNLPIANKAVKMDANGKLPVSALKIYDSGWFPVAASTGYSKTHNLGTTKVITQLWFSETADGSGLATPNPFGFHFDQANNQRGSNIVAITPTTISIRTTTFVYRGPKVGNNNVYYTSGYCRIIMLALE